MFGIGQIVADVKNKQLVMYLGMSEVEGTLCLLYVNEETFNDVVLKQNKKLEAKDCLLDAEATHIAGIPPIDDDFDKVKKAIAIANGAATAQNSRWGEESKNEPNRVYFDHFSLTLVDGEVVFTKNEKQSGKANKSEFGKYEDFSEIFS